MNKKSMLVPESLNFEELFKVFPPSFTYKIEVFYYLVYYIILNPFYTRNDKNLYVRLCTRGLQDNVHEKYNKYLDHLIDVGIIEKLLSASIDKCSSYKLNNEYYFDKLISMEITDFVIKKKMKKNIEICNKTLKKYNHLTKFLTDNKLSFQVITAQYEINKSVDTILANKDLKNLRKYHFSLFTIKHFIENHMWIKNNPNSDNRLHTNLTNMPKSMKQFIRYNDKSLIGIDIKNSQPVMLLIVLKCLLNKDINSDINNIIKRILTPNITINLLNNATTQTIIELKEYEDLVLSGRFYEYLGDKFLEKYPLQKPPYTHSEYDKTQKTSSKIEFDNIRDYMKVKTFEIYFSKNTKTNTKFKKLFAELFPSIDKLIRIIKEDDYVLLSRLMQQTESFIVLESITKTIYNKHKICQYTIHDSVATTPENIDLLESEFIKEFETITGFTPPIEREDWSKEIQMFKNVA